MLQFQWSTKTPSAVSARCVVTDLPLGKPGAKILLTQALPGMPSAAPHTFSVNFTTFMPKEPPGKPYVLSYYVYIILTNASKTDLAPSPAVTITYGQPGAQTQFEENMGVPASPEGAMKILALAIDQLKQRWGLHTPVGSPQTGPGISAFQRFRNAIGDADASVEVSGPTTNPTIYVGVPYKSPLGYGHSVFQWYRYTVDRYSRVVGAADPGSEIPGTTSPVLPNPGAWSNYSTYNGIPGDDPPHWSPVLVKSDSLTISRLHAGFVHPGGYEKSRELIENLGKMMATRDLTDRAMEQWQPVKLNGFVEAADYTSGDYGADHTEGYHDGDDVETGGVCEETDIYWPGLDWDMAIIPDPTYNYLASTVRPNVRVEMEHFALGIKSYWPQKNDWLQAIGRWVVDCGHTSYTEIHPPEVLVTTTQGYGDPVFNRARVTVTGAYLGGNDLTFAVYPPPRPSATSKMYYRKVKADGSPGCDRQDLVDLEITERGTPNNPNHLFVRVLPKGPSSVFRYNTGMVGYTADRGLQCVIECGWEGAEIGTATITTAIDWYATQPINSALLFYRGADVPGLPWQATTVGKDGRVSLQLQVGKKYWVRPAGSGWNFPAQREIILQHDKPLSVTINGTRDEAPPRTDLRGFAEYGRSVSAVSAAIRLGALASKSPVSSAEAASQALRSALISLQEGSGGTFGVKGNNLGYKESAQVYFRLKSLVGEDGQPIKDQASAVITDATTNPPSMALRGTPGDGVTGAKIRAKLLLGNGEVGFRVAAQAETSTGHQGLASIRLNAGSHVEEALVSIEVIENPANPWFLPRILTSSRLFYPGNVDTGDTTTGRVPYTLMASSLDLQAVRDILAGKGGTSEGKHFLGEVQERVAWEQNIRKRLGRGTAPALKTAYRKLLQKKK